MNQSNLIAHILQISRFAKFLRFSKITSRAKVSFAMQSNDTQYQYTTNSTSIILINWYHQDRTSYQRSMLQWQWVTSWTGVSAVIKPEISAIFLSKILLIRIYRLALALPHCTWTHRLWRRSYSGRISRSWRYNPWSKAFYDAKFAWWMISYRPAANS